MTKTIEAPPRQPVEAHLTVTGALAQRAVVDHVLHGCDATVAEKHGLPPVGQAVGSVLDGAAVHGSMFLPS